MSYISDQPADDVDVLACVQQYEFEGSGQTIWKRRRYKPASRASICSPNVSGFVAHEEM